MGDSNNCDPALLELFRAEMEAHIPVLCEGLLALEKGRGSDKDFEAMMRAAHSIKGAARIVGIEPAVRVSHAMEDCFSAAQGQRITLGSEAVDVLLHGVDALQKICSLQTDQAMSEPSIQSLLDRITAVRDGRSFEPLAEPPIPPAARFAAELATHEAQENHVALPEVLDIAAAEFLRNELCGILCQEPARIRLDFARVRHLSASALSLLASLARETTRTELATAVVSEGVSTEIAVLLRTTGLDKVIKRSE